MVPDMAVWQPGHMPRRGRPPLRSDDTILDVALRDFATLGYDATSVRALNAELGLSHETITQRFGTKEALFRAAVSHGVHRFVAEFDRELESATPADDLERLRATIRAFIVAMSHHPTLGELIHHQGIGDAEREVLMTDIGLSDRLLAVSTLLQRLRADGLIRDIDLREFWFLVQGGAGPLHFEQLARMFDPVDGPLERERHIERTTDMIVRAVRTDTPG